MRLQRIGASIQRLIFAGWEARGKCDCFPIFLPTEIELERVPCFKMNRGESLSYRQLIVQVVIALPWLSTVGYHTMNQLADNQEDLHKS